MNSKKIRNLFFYLHRYIGLFVGLILVIVGLTGSLPNRVWGMGCGV